MSSTAEPTYAPAHPFPGAARTAGRHTSYTHHIPRPSSAAAASSWAHRPKTMPYEWGSADGAQGNDFGSQPPQQQSFAPQPASSQQSQPSSLHNMQRGYAATAFERPSHHHFDAAEPPRGYGGQSGPSHSASRQLPRLSGGAGFEPDMSASAPSWSSSGSHKAPSSDQLFHHPHYQATGGVGAIAPAGEFAYSSQPPYQSPETTSASSQSGWQGVPSHPQVSFASSVGGQRPSPSGSGGAYSLASSTTSPVQQQQPYPGAGMSQSGSYQSYGATNTGHSSPPSTASSSWMHQQQQQQQPTGMPYSSSSSSSLAPSQLGSAGGGGFGAGELSGSLGASGMYSSSSGSDIQRQRHHFYQPLSADILSRKPVFDSVPLSTSSSANAGMHGRASAGPIGGRHSLPSARHSLNSPYASVPNTARTSGMAAYAPSGATAPFSPPFGSESSFNALREAHEAANTGLPGVMTSPGGYAGNGFVTDEEKWIAICNHSHAADRFFVYGAMTTRIYCRPSCASKRPERSRVRFFPFPNAALKAEESGFRPCKRCKPGTTGTADQCVLAVGDCVRHITQSSAFMAGEGAEADLKRKTLKEYAARAGLSAFHFHRSFKAVTSLTPGEYAKACHALTLQDSIGKDGNNGATISAEGLTAALQGWSSRRARRAVGGLVPSAYASGLHEVDAQLTVAHDTPYGPVAILFTEPNQDGDAEGTLFGVLIGPDAEARLQQRAPQAVRRPDRELWLTGLVGDLYRKGEREVQLPAEVVPSIRRARVWSAVKEALGKKSEDGGEGHTSYDM